MALPHLLVGIRERSGAHLFFVLATSATIAIAVGELTMMHAGSVGRFARAQQLTHLPIFVLIVALVGLVRLYFGYRSALAWPRGRLLCASSGWSSISLFRLTSDFRQITALRHFNFLGESVSAPVGVVSPWTFFGELSSLLSANIRDRCLHRSWQAGTRESRRHALVVGTTITSVYHRGGRIGGADSASSAH